MGFFDLDEFAQEAEKISIPPHPLADKLSLDKKISYLGMLFFAASVDDGKVADGETKKFREIGFSLNLKETDINETRETVEGLLTNASKMAFVKEAVSLLQERETAMFLYSDMVCIMGADGELSSDAEKFLDGMTKFLELEERDCCFLKEYSAFIPEKKKSKAAEIVQKYRTEKFYFPEGLIKYYTPVLDAVKLHGGKLPLGENQICDGKFILEEELIVGPGSELIIKNAEIEFGLNGYINIAESASAVISDSSFSASPVQPKDGEEFAAFMIQSNISLLNIKGCSFDGKMIKSAIYQRGKLNLSKCSFERLHGGRYYAIESGVDSVFSDCDFMHCTGNLCHISAGGKVSRCKFTDCSSEDEIALVSSGSLYLVLFERCQASTICERYGDKKWGKEIVCFKDCSRGEPHSLLSFGFDDTHTPADYSTWLEAYTRSKENKNA